MEDGRLMLSIVLMLLCFLVMLFSVRKMPDTVHLFDVAVVPCAALQREEDGRLMLSDLPDDVLRKIMFCLADHRDLVNTGLTASRSFSLSEENAFWRHLCLFHFTNKQWLSVFRRGEDIEALGWKALYSRLNK